MNACMYIFMYVCMVLCACIQDALLALYDGKVLISSNHVREGVNMCVCACVCVCMYVCMYVCIYVCMYGFVCMHARCVDRSV